MAYIVKRMVKGKDYFFEVQGYRENGKVKQRVLRYFGRQDPRKNPDAKPIVKQQVVATYRFGDVALLYHCAKFIKLVEIIDKYMPKRQGLSHGLLIFFLATHRLTEYKPSSSNLQRWCKSTFLPKLLSFNPDKINVNTVSYTMDCVHDEDRNIDHTFRIAKDLYDYAHRRFGIEEDTYFYDLTSTYFEGRCCPIARFGYSRDGLTDKLQINIGMVVDKTLGLPMMTKVFEGNIHDTKTVYEMVYYAKFILKKEKGMLIMDRGMDSEDNIRIMDTTGYDYVIGLSSRNGFVNKLKLTNDPTKKGWTEFKTNNKKILLKKFVKNIFGKRRIVLLYYNKDMAETQKEIRNRKIKYAEEQLRETSNLTLKKISKNIKGVSKYFEIITKKNKIIWKKNQIEINRAEKKSGKFCIATNKDLPPKDIYILYFSKDKVEKGFRHMKQDLGLHPTRKRLPDRVRADVFICHIGYLLLTLAEKLVRDKKIDIFWDVLSTETKEIRLLEYKKRSDNFHYDYVTNNKIQQNIVDKLNLNKYVPHPTKTNG